MTGQLDKWEIVMGFPPIPVTTTATFLSFHPDWFWSLSGGQRKFRGKTHQDFDTGEKNRQDIADGKKNRDNLVIGEKKPSHIGWLKTKTRQHLGMDETKTRHTLDVGKTKPVTKLGWRYIEKSIDDKKNHTPLQIGNVWFGDLGNFYDKQLPPSELY